MSSQLAFDLAVRTWGGKRDGAGRKSNKSKGLPSHDSPHTQRPMHAGRYPLHVVLRTVRDMQSLRCSEIFACVHRALRKIAGRADFRIVHISIQRNHVHLVVEAADNAALGSGMRAFAICLAKRINRALGRTGKVFEFRYHATSLRSPRQVRNAIVYVLNNWRRHREDERNGVAERLAILDRYSSAISFQGWADWRLGAWPAGYVALPVASAQTWLLEKGWQKAKRPIRTTDTPGPI